MSQSNPYQAKINQHYVPRSYLSRFTFDEVRVHVYDKPTGKEFTAPIRGVASEKHFYDIHGESIEDVQIIENTWMDLEGHQNEIIRSIVNETGVGKKIDKNTKNVLAYICILQFLRTKKWRSVIRQKTEALLNDASYLQKGNFDLRQEALELATFTFDPAIIHPRVEELTNDSYCIIWLNTSRKTFYTSDAPVVRNPFYSSVEQIQEKLETAFPLGPRHLLVFYQGKQFSKYQRKDMTFQYIRSEQIKYYNQLQIDQSDRQVFSIQPGIG